MGNALLSIIQAAGWPIWPLILCSIAAVALIIERFTSLRPVRVAPPKLLEEVVAVTRTALPSNDVISRLADSSVLGRVLASGIRAVVSDARINEAGLRNAFELAGREAMHQLERYLNALATISTAAPLLGLLGTVIGMIEIFAAQNAGGGVANPQQLAYGISIALYNTAFGLIIAIPALMFYRYFRGVVNDYRMAMEQAAERMVPLLLRHTIGRTGGHPA
jgi:biopolymer transport protein ExbB